MTKRPFLDWAHTCHKYYLQSTNIHKYVKRKKQSFTRNGDDLLKKVKEIIHEGNVRRIIIKDTNDNIFVEIPVTLGIIGAVIAPILAAVGAIDALVAKFKIEVIKKEEENQNEATEK